MKQFRVTINLSFLPHYWEDEYSSYEESMTENRAKKVAFDRTDAYYATHDVVEYIKSTNSAMDMVEYIFCDGEVKSAQWDPEEFQIHMLVESDQTAVDLLEELKMNSLEDGEYETCGESGWVLFTRDENGKAFGPPWDTSDVWEYGLVDYRDNPMEVELIDPQTS